MQILSNPFPDLKTNKQDPITSKSSSDEILIKEKNRKSVKNVNLLSFVDELENGEDSLVATVSDTLLKCKSSHDFETEGLESYQPAFSSSEAVASEVISHFETGRSAQLIAEDSREVDKDQTISCPEIQYIKKSKHKRKVKESLVQPNNLLTKVINFSLIASLLEDN